MCSYFVTFDLNSGSVVDLRYRSNILCSSCVALVQNGNYIVMAMLCTDQYLVLFDTVIYSFSVYKSSYTLMCGCIDPIYGRLIFVGYTSANGYITKFSHDFINAHPDFVQSASLSMDLVQSGDDEFSSEIWLPSIILNPSNIATQLYTYYSLSYCTIPPSYTSDVSFQTSEQIITVSENSNVEINLDLTCSISGSTVIKYSTSNYGSFIQPSWISIS